MDATRILNTFYPGVSTARNQAKRARRVWSIMRGSKNGHKAPRRKWAPYLVVGSLAVAVWSVFHLYYYNLLVDQNYNVQAAWADVEAQFQRRYNIQQNLTQIVMDYSKYEKDTLTELIKMRTAKQLTRSELAKLFPDVLLTAEQYPELKLTENFQQFSAAIVDTESKIAEQVMAYNEAVNTYTTTRTQFPGNFFGTIFGFETYDYYEPDEELLDFKPVKSSHGE